MEYNTNQKIKTVRTRILLQVLFVFFKADFAWTGSSKADQSTYHSHRLQIIKYIFVSFADTLI